MFEVTLQAFEVEEPLEKAWTSEDIAEKDQGGLNVIREPVESHAKTV
jgi:hypothetical protein